MRPRKAWFAGLVGVVLGSPATLWAQAVPEIPPLPAAGGLGGTGALGGASGLTGAAGAAQPQTLFGFLGLSKANCQACLSKICQSQFGQMLNSGLTPISALAGGFIPPICPPVPNTSPAALAGLPGGPNGAAATAAKIKADEAAAAARVAAVEYLATVDCARWPDARDALIAALRGDKNECVRFAAAKALGSGCCCSPKVIEALKASVSGEADKDPAELSPRVRGAAFAALQNCLARVPAEVKPEPIKVEPEGPKVRTEGPAASSGAADPTHIAAGHTVTIPETRPDAEKSTAQIIEEARQTLITTAQNPPRVGTLPTGKRSMFHALAKAWHESSVPAGPIPPPPPPIPTLSPIMNSNPAQPSLPDPNQTPSQGIVPTSFVVPASTASESPATAPAVRPRTAGRRSLTEILLQSWNPGTGQ
jgi:hypothetical protein